jgi:hypothetical protein
LLEIKINSEPAQPLSVICHRDQAYRVGRQLCSKLKELIPRQMFRVPIQVNRGGGEAGQQTRGRRVEVPDGGCKLGNCFCRPGKVASAGVPVVLIADSCVFMG